MTEPKAGDTKLCKGTEMIRQPKRNKNGSAAVNHGRLLYEWVVKGGPKDRTSPNFATNSTRIVNGAEHD
jgi:hypothetical protein